MRLRAALGAAAAAVVLALGPAAGAGPASPPASPAASLSASPSRVRVAAGGRSLLRVTNAGSRAVVVTAAPAGYALDLRGRPRIAGASTSAPWLVVRPRQFALPPGATLPLTVAAALPGHASPGDHAALVLLATRPAGVGRVEVALRLGVVVDVRVPGVVVRRLVLGRARVRRLPGGRALEVVVANRGNVSELLRPGRLRVTLLRRGRLLAVLRSPDQELLPHTVGVIDFHYGGAARGRVTAIVELSRATTGGPVRRRFELHL